MPHKFEITEDDILRIARTGAQNPHDEEIVRVVFQELSQPTGTVGAISDYAQNYVLTVSQLFELVKHAPPYLEGSIQVGGFQIDIFAPEEYLLRDEFRMRDTVHSLGYPEITAAGFAIPLYSESLYDKGIILTVHKKYIEGFADKLEALYGFQCVAQKGEARLRGATSLTLRGLVQSLQRAVFQNPDLPVILTKMTSSYDPNIGAHKDVHLEYPLLGVCWIEEDDTVILNYAVDINED